MSDEKDRELSALFANEARSPDAAGNDATSRDAAFVDRVRSKLQTRRRLILAARIVLLLAVVIVIAPFVPSFIASLLKTVGL